jgi:hypothetical protein
MIDLDLDHDSRVAGESSRVQVVAAMTPRGTLKNGGKSSAMIIESVARPGPRPSRYQG